MKKCFAILYETGQTCDFPMSPLLPLNTSFNAIRKTLLFTEAQTDSRYKHTHTCSISPSRTDPLSAVVYINTTTISNQNSLQLILKCS